GLDTSSVAGVASSDTWTDSGSDSSNLVATGHVTQTMAETPTLTYTSETVSSGSSNDIWNEYGTITSTLSDTSSAATTTTLTTSSTLGGITDTDTSTLTDSPQSSMTTTDTDTLSLNETDHETYTSSGLVSTGSSTQALTDTLSGGS